MENKLRIKRSVDDLKEELIDQIRLLQDACNRYDSGLDAIGKHIALNLRVLLHHHGQSRSLLEQLGIRQIDFYDTAGAIDPAEMLPKCGLVMHIVSTDQGRYIPRVNGPPNPNHQIRKIPFEPWWKEPILKTKDGILSRCDLVLNVADTDGGAHVDPELESTYMNLSRKNSLGWNFRRGDINKIFKGRPELACMRQIAEEVLKTLKESNIEYF